VERSSGRLRRRWRRYLQSLMTTSKTSRAGVTEDAAAEVEEEEEEEKEKGTRR
jgi:hypothetical protein